MAWEGDITVLRRGDAVSLPHSLHFPSGANHFPTITTSSITSNDKQAVSYPVNLLPWRPHYTYKVTLTFSSQLSPNLSNELFSCYSQGLYWLRCPPHPCPSCPLAPWKALIVQVWLGDSRTPLFSPLLLRRDLCSHPVRCLSDAMDHWLPFTL